MSQMDLFMISPNRPVIIFPIPLRMRQKNVKLFLRDLDIVCLPGFCQYIFHPYKGRDHRGRWLCYCIAANLAVFPSIEGLN